MAQFDELMQRALTVRNNVAPSSNTAILVGGVLVSIVSALQLLLDTKQGTLTFDNEPTDGSTNPVTSDGIYEAIADAIASIDLSACEKIVNKVTTINAQSTDVQYPSAKLLYDSLQVVDAYLNNLDARVTSLENDPPVTYTIRGTSSNIGGTETFKVRFIAKGATQPAPAQLITVEVNSVGYWEFKYVNKGVYSLRDFAQSSATLLTCDFSLADDFSRTTDIQSAFYNCVNITSVNLSNATFESVTTSLSMFRNCGMLSVIEWGQGLNFQSLVTSGLSSRNSGMFQNCTSLSNLDAFAHQRFASLVNAYDMFNGCTSLASIDLSSATFDALKYATAMFFSCSALTTIDLHSADFSSLIRATNMFSSCTALLTIDLSTATFDNLEQANNMFWNCGVAVVDISAAKFDNLQTAYRMFRDCTALHSINMPIATFENVTDSRQAFQSTTSLSSITINTINCAILPTSTPADASLDLHWSPLDYTSMLTVANWVSDLTGQSAHTVTFKTSAWNALTAAEQANIDAILSAKNWTRAIA